MDLDSGTRYPVAHGPLHHLPDLSGDGCHHVGNRLGVRPSVRRGVSSGRCADTRPLSAGPSVLVELYRRVGFHDDGGQHCTIADVARAVYLRMDDAALRADRVAILE